MKRLYTAIHMCLAAVLILGCNNTMQHEEETKAGGDIKPKTAAEIIKQEKVKVIDVRTPEEYEEGYIEDAILMDYYDRDFEQNIDEYPRDITYVVYCHSGGRSAEAVEKMEKMGFEKVYNIEGGIRDWKKEGLEVKK